MCDGTKIGEFEVTTYEVSGNGVEIEGCFNWNGTACDSCHNFRLLQIVYHIDHMPLHYPPQDADCSDNGIPPVPFTDTPKGGYCEDPWDNEPWYNEPGDGTPGCPYPYYLYDGPGVKLIGADALLGAAVDNDVRFETWVVCFGEKPNTMCGLAHIRWGYKRVGGVVTKYDLDGTNRLTNAEINTALVNGLFPEWTFSDNYLDCCLPRCPDQVHNDTERTAIELDVLYSGTGGTIRDVTVISLPPDCGNPYINVVNGNQINFRWQTPCFDYCETIEYEFTVDYPCEQVFITDIEWTYPSEPPTLSQWVLIILALSVGAFFVWQLMRRRRAAASV
ncbi:MAG: hypothetical protein WBD64_03625 [Candidatus Zixiibacteriota bacterium]